MTTCIYLKDNDKPFAYNENYLFCDVCTLNDNPDEQFVIIIDEYRFMSGNAFAIRKTLEWRQYRNQIMKEVSASSPYQQAVNLFYFQCEGVDWY